jgi:hypothetical protein
MKRSDGRLLKTIGPFMKIHPYIADRRSGAQVFSKQRIQTATIDAYIKEKSLQGLSLTYLHIIIAVYVRVIAQRPQLNRFVVNSRIYARNRICISMVVKRALRDEGEETSLNFVFTGKESIFDVAEIIDRDIRNNIKAGTSNEVDKIAAGLMSLPGFLVKGAARFLKAMDQHNLLPQQIIAASPFHTSLFLTYLKSINLDYVYHHLYDFGTTGIFVAVGKSKRVVIAEGSMPVVEKCCDIGYVLDERICDGIYFSNSFKLVKRYLNNPSLLEEGLESIVEDIR